MKITSSFNAHGGSFDTFMKMLDERTLKMRKEYIKSSDLKFCFDCDPELLRDPIELKDDEVLMHIASKEDVEAFEKKGKKFSLMKISKKNLGEEEGYAEIEETGMFAYLGKEKLVFSPKALMLLATMSGYHAPIAADAGLIDKMYLIKKIFENDKVFSLLFKSEAYVDKDKVPHVYKKVYGIGESRFCFGADFFREVVTYIHDDLGLSIKEWTYTNEMYKVAFALKSFEGISPVLVIQDSDCMASSFTMKIEYHIGKGHFIGKEVTYKHTRGLSKKDYKSDIDEILSDVENLSEALAELDAQKVGIEDVTPKTFDRAFITFTNDPKGRKVFPKQKHFLNDTLESLPQKDEYTKKEVVLHLMKNICLMKKNEVDMTTIRKKVREMPECLKEGA